ncbi:oxysterol-binding protein-related protein 8 isoform X5 [Stomoxys calcitrans]|uniref:oxysterol-binding protein-related protein 8 isoform X5 n=1 Tax=Stomoxys calcitrans TaxID=35570 RepID=UPI0027E28BF2|nr:oxysterol-binding protein-related protein 8 isoform X5 [Stomoxys calcitrans]
MAQSSSKTGSNTNLMASGTSTPIRIGSYHGHVSSSGGGGGSDSPTPMAQSQTQSQQSSSVPTSAGHLGQSSASLNMGPSTHQQQQQQQQQQQYHHQQSQPQQQQQQTSSSTIAMSSSVTPPNSAGLRQSGAFEFKFMRRSSLKTAHLPKLSSTDSLSYSPGPSSPGLANWASDSRDKYDGNQTEKTSSADASKLNRKESYKAQRKNYRREKKRVASELLNSLQDPAVIVLADWLKVRGTLKSWTKLWCVLKPGLLLLYKSPKVKSSHWVGTILLTSCQVIERPSKKDGFCFKLFHPLEQSIWAPRGPDKETIGAVVQPLPTAYLIFRAPSQAAGKCWMDALELSLRCSGLLLRSNSSPGPNQGPGAIEASISHETQWSEADYEKHFNDQVDSRLLTYFPLDLDADSQTEAPTGIMSGVDTDSDSDGNDNVVDNQLQAIDNEEPIETPYIPSPEEELNTTSGEQVEELAEENKSLIWCLVKQVRPGMDLSKVVLPTFILEPRSFLDKLSDSYYHADILSRAVLEDDPFTRMKLVVQWYLSGFYKKPKGLKKPYNPILGETYRCYWEHDNGSRTYYIAEQVSHHPPVSAFYVTNRQEGFCISCSILAKSKFYGNSTSAVLEGVATLTLLPRGESYTLTTPYAHCKGILMGTLSMELGGKINIECENTGYKTELEFKLKPFLGGADSTNIVAGKIRLGKETLATISGHWDAEMRIKDAKTGEDSILFAATKDIMKKRLMRYVVPLDSQLPNESERLWNLVSAAIRRDDQVGATEEKTVLEESQRNAAKERKVTFTEWEPLHFQQDIITGKWIYKYADLRPWDPRNDVKQFEWDYKILTKTRHQAPMVRTASIVSVDPMHVIRNCASDQRQSSLAMMKAKRKTKQLTKLANDPNNSDSSQSPDDLNDHPVSSHTVRKLMLAVDQLNNALDDHKRQLVMINAKLERLQYAPPHHTEHSSSFWGVITRTIPQPLVIRALAYAFAALLVSLCLKWLLH